RRLLVEKYRGLVGDGVSVLDSEVEKEFLRRNQKTSVDWILVDAARLTATAPDETALTSWYETRKERYMRDDGRTGKFVQVNHRDLASTMTGGDPEVRAAYDRDRDTRYTQREQRRASHILFKLKEDATPAEATRVETKARDVLRRARTGEDFAALAKKY